MATVATVKKHKKYTVKVYMLYIQYTVCNNATTSFEKRL